MKKEDIASKEKQSVYVGGGEGERVHAGTNGRDLASKFQLSLWSIMFWNSELAVIWKYYKPPQAFLFFFMQCIFLHHADLGKQLTLVLTVLEWQVAKSLLVERSKGQKRP